MRRILFFVVLVMLFLYGNSFSMVLLDIKVEEKVKGEPENFKLIDEITVELYDSFETSSFLGNFTLSAQPTTFDSSNLTLSISLFTLGPDIQKFFKEYLTKSGQEIALPELRAKNDILFRVRIVPHVVPDEDRGCNLNTRDLETWYSDFCTHFYFHYIRETLPDYHWNANKGFLEKFYHKIWDKFEFWDPSKIDYFLAPCQLKEIFWDKRHKMGLDPTKRKVYVIYNQKTRTIDGPGARMFMFYKYWGYAPAMVVEGAAGSVELAHHNAKKLKKKGKLFPLKKLEISKDYKSKPKEVAYYQVSSFIKYLVDNYGLGKFKRFYDQVTDLTFEEAFFGVYDKKLSEVEREWLKYLDTFEELKGNLEFFVSSKVAYRHYDEAIELLNDLLEISGEEVGYLSDLGGIHYTMGHYEKAESSYVKLVELKPESPIFVHVLANTYNLLGDYAKAESLYIKSMKLDSNYISPILKLGDLYVMQEKHQKAKELFGRALSKSPGTEGAIRIFLGLADCNKALGEKEQAEEDLGKALFQAQMLLVNLPERSAPYHRNGQVYLAMGFADTAVYYLEVAAMLQDIPHKRGKILLNLAETYQEIGDFELAERVCQEILEINSGAREKSQAERLLTELKGRKRGQSENPDN